MRAQLEKVDVNYAESRFGLTILAVATITKNHEILNHVLSQANINPCPKDHGGLTPLHYAAALSDTYSMEALQVKMKTERISKDVFELFPFWKDILAPNFPKDGEFVAFWREKKDEIIPLSAKAYYEKTSVRFYNGITSDQKNFVYLMVKRLENPLSQDENLRILNEYFISQFSTFHYNPELFCLGLQEKAGQGVFVQGEVKKGQILMMYGGEVCSELPKITPYILPPFNGKDISNLASKINDGFPNCCVVTIDLPDGRRLSLFVAISDISKDDALFWDYGSEHSVKIHPRSELNSKEMCAFFEQHSPLVLWKQLLENDRLKSRKPEDIYSDLTLRTRLAYPFTTLSALFLLFLKHKISLEEIGTLLSDPLFNKMLENIELSKKITSKSMRALSLFSMKHIAHLAKGESDKGLSDKFYATCLEYNKLYSFQVLNLFIGMLQVNKKSIQDWNKDKEHYDLATSTCQLLFSGFVPPTKLEINSGYESECFENLKKLPSFMSRFILGTFMGIEALSVESREILAQWKEKL